MISKTFEWYRMVTATPSTQAVEARTKAGTESTASLGKQDPRTVLALTQGIVRHFDGSPAEAGTADWLLRILKQYDPAVSENLAENQMELRFMAAITLGELLWKSTGKTTKRATAAAAAFVSAVHMRALPRQRHLRAIIQQLSKLALDVLENGADARRKRVDVRQLPKDNPDITDIPTAKQAVLQLQKQIIDLHRNAIVDGEEINLFWFIATGFSRTRREAFSELAASVAAVHAALEVHRFLLLPAPLCCFGVLAAILESNRKPKDLKPAPLETLLTNWSSQEWDAIAAADSLEARLAPIFPAVFPVTWISNRMREGQSLPKWTEFKRLTHLQGDADVSAVQLARQLLNEKIAISLAGDLLE